ncbi:MAG: c-type cytochrome [Acidobacteria bacterium]|nr:c-type cytochrome [Acidobacteriota bacterium]
MTPSNLLVAALAILPGDARQGARIFTEQKCIVCHSVEGKGGKAAPDLGSSSSRAYTPSLLASLIWNHAPRMWSAMAAAGIPNPKLSEQDAADLFAYFYAFRYFDQPGDAARGAQAFKDHRCAECHSLSEAGPGNATPVRAWRSLADSIALASAMWNHAPRMREAMASRRVPWPCANRRHP